MRAHIGRASFSASASTSELCIRNMAQYVFTMNRVGKVVPPKRQILKDISLSFFPGAKIGVLGLNGAGEDRAAQKLWPASIRITKRSDSDAESQDRVSAQEAAARP